MIYKEITAKDNPLIKLVGGLQTSAKARRESGLFVLEGLRLLSDAAENGVPFEKVIVSASAAEKYGEDLEILAQNAAERIRIPDHLFSKISDTKSPQGVCAVCKTVTRAADEIDRNGKYVLLDGVADPANVGAIARTGEALGVSGIILTGNSCDPYAPKVLRASMGTLLRLPLFFLDDIRQNPGLTLYACVVERSATDIRTCAFRQGSAIVIGNEANGISDAVRKAADHCVTVPMRGKAESLNAAAAAAIAIWEMMK